MARYVIGSNVTVAGVPYLRDQVAELTSTQAAAITGAGGKLGAANSPGGAIQVGSPTHDMAGEATGVSNSA